MAHIKGHQLIINGEAFEQLSGLAASELFMPIRGYIKLVHIIDPFGMGQFDMIQWVPDPEQAILN